MRVFSEWWEVIEYISVVVVTLIAIRERGVV